MIIVNRVYIFNIVITRSRHSARVNDSEDLVLPLLYLSTTSLGNIGHASDNCLMRLCMINVGSRLFRFVFEQ
jgi:hypothetical protein